MLTICFSNGASVTVSEVHRFLASDDWIYASELQLGAVVLLPSFECVEEISVTYIGIADDPLLR